jgi:hypothetical protein
MSEPITVSGAPTVARAIEDFLDAHPHAAILEDGHLLFDLKLASHSVSADHGRCLLHLWSAERNLVRVIESAEPRRETLRLQTRRFGASRPQTLTLVPDPDFRTPTARDSSRRRYLRGLEQAMVRHFPDWNPEGFRSGMDIEHSFGPAYARGLMTQGQKACAVIGVGPEELPAVIDGALTLGILWLAYCRAHSSRNRIVQGLKVVVPAGCAAITQSRMAWLHQYLAQWELYELHPATGDLSAVSIADVGNLDVQLVHAFDPRATLDRSAAAVEFLTALLPEDLRAATEIRPRTPTEIGFSLHGLEYARIRHGLAAGSFARQDEITFGAGPSETVLDESTQPLFLDLMDRLFRSRHANASAVDPLFRLQPERWLESVLRRDLSVVEPGLGTGPVYCQVPAFSAGGRTLLDLLTVTREGRLAVIEVKADDDLQLPLQALDYWTRVRTLHCAGELIRHGYFPGVEVSPKEPLLYLVAPALHIHPANETVLQHLSAAVPWEVIGVDERWREQCRVVLRKHRIGS